MKITDRTTLEQIPAGTLMVDKDGLPMTRTPDGDFAFFAEGAWTLVHSTEVDGTMQGEDQSGFFPITVEDSVNLRVKIDNVYEDGESVFKVVDIEAVSPPHQWQAMVAGNIDDEPLQEWAYEWIFPHTGTGKFSGDAGYFAEIVHAHGYPELVGALFEWGI